MKNQSLENRRKEIALSMLEGRAIELGIRYGFYFDYSKNDVVKKPVMCTCIAFFGGNYCRTISLCSLQENPSKIDGKINSLRRVLRVHKNQMRDAVYSCAYEHFNSPKALSALVKYGFKDDVIKCEYPVAEEEIYQKEKQILKKFLPLE
jgi:hypothetical protein